MHTTWTEKLSEYIDGELNAAEAAALQRHLLSCEECAAIHAELLQVVHAARDLTDTGPERDLWAGIATRIGATALPTTQDVLPITAARSAQRRFSFSLPQLAAAAVVLMALSGGAVYLLGARQQEMQLAAGTIMHSSGAATGDTRLVSSPAPEPSPLYDNDVAELEQLLEEQREQLDPQTIEVVERSLEAIDGAIADARTALETDPGNPYLHRQLDNTMQKKLDILRRATRVNRGGS